MVLKEQESIKKYKILEKIKFTSKRKRMSIIVEDTNGDIWIYTKGADDVIKPDLKDQNSKDLIDCEEQSLKAAC